MKWVLVILICVLAGCASNKTTPAATQTIAAIIPTLPVTTNKFVVIHPPPPALTSVTVSWVCNYVPGLTNEVTGLVASADLTVPMTNWPTIFIGATNQHVVQITGPQMFFNVYNTLQ